MRRATTTALPKPMAGGLRQGPKLCPNSASIKQHTSPPAIDRASGLRGAPPGPAPMHYLRTHKGQMARNVHDRQAGQGAYSRKMHSHAGPAYAVFTPWPGGFYLERGDEPGVQRYNQKKAHCKRNSGTGFFQNKPQIPQNLMVLSKIGMVLFRHGPVQMVDCGLGS